MTGVSTGLSLSLPKTSIRARKLDFISLRNFHLVRYSRLLYGDTIARNLDWNRKALLSKYINRVRYIHA